MILIDYCISARINRLLTDFRGFSSLGDPSPSFAVATVETTISFFGPRGPFVIACTSLTTSIDVVASLAGRAGVTVLTLETIHPK